MIRQSLSLSQIAPPDFRAVSRNWRESRKVAIPRSRYPFRLAVCLSSVKFSSQSCRLVPSISDFLNRGGKSDSELPPASKEV
jgi:hypothetical protein